MSTELRSLTQTGRRARRKGRAVSPPRRFGSFVVEEHLASTGMSTVYLGDDVETSRPVAIKTAQPNNVVSAERLRAEIALLRELHHPGVARVLAHGIDERVPWYAMPYLPGLAFGAVVADSGDQTSSDPDRTRDDVGGAASPAPASDTGAPAVRPVDWHSLGVVRKLCDTLAWLHGRGIVHRDLKPSNVLLDDDDNPVLIDFGITARVADRSGRERLAHDPARAGTYGFMSPEQRRGDDVDPRTDLFSVGCILYRILTGALPNASSAAEPCATRSPREINPDIPAPLSDLVMALLPEAPGARVGYAVDVGRALEALGAGAGLPGLPEPQPYLYRPSFVGHRALLDAAERAVEQPGKRLFVVGPSGAGKTRTAQELIRRARAGEREVIMAHCGDSAHTTGGARAAAEPLQGFRPFFRRLAERCLQGDEDAHEIVGDVAPLLGRYEPLLAQLSAEAVPAAPLDEHDAEMMSARVQAAVTGLLDRYARVYRPLLVIDDVQWADELSEGVLRRLALDAGAAPELSLVLTMRSEQPVADFERMAALASSEVLELPLLSDDEVADLAREMLADPSPPAGLLAHVVDCCAGNPFFVVAYLNESVANGALTRGEQGWRLLDGASAPTEPPTLATLLESRLERLDPEAHRFVDAGCILGRRFNVDDAAALVGTPPDQLRSTINTLRVRQVIDEAEDGTVRFAHDKLLEHAYAHLDEGRRRDLHARAATLLEGRSGEPTVLIARHLKLGGAVELAVEKLIKAASEALASGRHRLARSLLEDARTLRSADGHPLFDALPLETNARMRELESRAAFAARDHHACEVSGTAGLALYRVRVPSSRSSTMVGLLRAVTRQVWNRWAPARLVHLEGDAAIRARRRASWWAEVAFAKQHQNQMGAYLVCELSALNEAERANDLGHAAHHLSVVAYVLSFIGLRSLSERWFERAIAWARGCDDVVREMVCRTMRSAHYLDLSRWAEAEHDLTLLRERCRQRGADEQMTWNTVMCLLTAVLSGKMQDARHYADELHELSRTGEHHGTIGEGSAIIAGMFLQLGEHERARKEAEDAIAMLTESREVALRACCIAVLAMIDGRNGDHQRALDRLREIERLLPDGGSNNFQAYHVHVIVPELLLDLAHAAKRGELPSHDESDLRRRAIAAMRNARKQAKRRPLLWANVARQEAKLARLVEPGRALDVAERAVSRAYEGKLRYEEAASLSLLAALPEAGAERRREARRKAMDIFRELGCAWDIEQVEQLERGEQQP